ncbi:MAG TPA: DUF4426 domain-containing protein [Aquimonas sp.]|nr:DUF4426 domain-containing protein [Aquimonas sp.]
MRIVSGLGALPLSGDFREYDMSLLRVASLAVWLLFSATTWAQAQSSFTQHGYTVHYNAIPSVMLTPEVARSYGLTRSAQRAVLNIAVRSAGDSATAHSVSAEVQAVAINSAGQRQNLRMREVREQEAIYAIGELRIDEGELYQFEVDVTPAGESRTITLHFAQSLFGERR